MKRERKISRRRYLTPEQQQLLDEVYDESRKFANLELHNKAKREAFLADDPDGSKHAAYDVMRQADSERQRL